MLTVIAWTLTLSAASAAGSLPFLCTRSKLSARALAIASAACAGLMLTGAFGILNEVSDSVQSDVLLGGTLDLILGVAAGAWILSGAEALLDALGLGDAVRDSTEQAPLPPPIPAPSPPAALSHARTPRRTPRCTSRHTMIEPQLQSPPPPPPPPPPPLPPRAPSQRALTFLASITLHALAEGCGVGIAFASNADTGTMYAIAMCLHAVPEGSAITAVLIASGVSPVRALFLNLAHALPQVLVAVPAFAFCSWAVRAKRVAAGIASGSLLYTSLVDLLPEALEHCFRDDSRRLTPKIVAFVVMSAAMLMMSIEAIVLGETKKYKYTNDFGQPAQRPRRYAHLVSMRTASTPSRVG